MNTANINYRLLGSEQEFIISPSIEASLGAGMSLIQHCQWQMVVEKVALFPQDD